MKVVVGTRGSALAVTQTQSVVERLRDLFPPVEFVVQTIRTAGDINTEQPLTEIGGQGVFVKELELALQRGAIDLAVHSLKDVPAVLGDGLALAATLRRIDPRDVVISANGSPLRDLKPRAVIGTGSQRREAQLRAIRPDLRFLPIRGNVDTRLRKLDEGHCDALVLAAAGLQRLGKTDRITEFLEPDVMLPAVGQGVLALECRVGTPAAAIASTVNDFETGAAVTAERAFLRRLGVGCELPVGAYARVAASTITLHGMIARADGSCARDSIKGAIPEASEVGTRLAETLIGCTAEVPA